MEVYDRVKGEGKRVSDDDYKEPKHVPVKKKTNRTRRWQVWLMLFKNDFNDFYKLELADGADATFFFFFLFFFFDFLLEGRLAASDSAARFLLLLVSSFRRKQATKNPFV